MPILAFQKPDKVVMLEANSFFGKFEFKPLLSPVMARQSETPSGGFSFRRWAVSPSTPSESTEWRMNWTPFPE